MSEPGESYWLTLMIRVLLARLGGSAVITPDEMERAARDSGIIESASEPGDAVFTIRVRPSPAQADLPPARQCSRQSGHGEHWHGGGGELNHCPGVGPLRLCDNCGKPMAQHCTTCLVPCCPGRCHGG